MNDCSKCGKGGRDIFGICWRCFYEEQDAKLASEDSKASRLATSEEGQVRSLGDAPLEGASG